MHTAMMTIPKGHAPIPDAAAAGRVQQRSKVQLASEHLQHTPRQVAQRAHVSALLGSNAQSTAQPVVQRYFTDSHQPLNLFKQAARAKKADTDLIAEYLTATAPGELAGFNLAVSSPQNMGDLHKWISDHLSTTLDDIRKWKVKTRLSPTPRTL
jgi:hypothetical protein